MTRLFLLSLTGLTLAFAGCGSEPAAETSTAQPDAATRSEADLQPVLMQLDWIHNAQFAGIYQAVEQGFYADAGFAVEIRTAPKSRSVVESVADYDGLAIGSSESNVLLVARAEGQPVVALATMFQDSPMGWAYLEESGIEGVEDFAGKTIGIHADGEKVIDIALAANGLTRNNLTFEKVGWDPVIVAKGEVDLMQVYVIDEFVKLQLMTDGGAGIVMAKDNGYLAYSQVMFAMEDDVAAYPAAIAAFLKATQQGWEYAAAHQAETVDLIISEYNPELDPAYQRASLAEVINLVKPDGRTALAPMDPEKWAASMALFQEHGIIEDPVDLQKLLNFSLNP
ncbi:MAG: ABC transporter substrate-binding protein [Opitutales bacterium]